MLDAVLEYGFDPDGADSPVFENCPGLSHHSFWAFYEVNDPFYFEVNDPFYFKSFAMIVNNVTGTGEDLKTPIVRSG